MSMYYHRIPAGKRRYILGLLNLAPQFPEPEDQAQIVLRARLIAMQPRRSSKRRPRR